MSKDSVANKNSEDGLAKVKSLFGSGAKESNQASFTENKSYFAENNEFVGQVVLNSDALIAGKFDGEMTGFKNIEVLPTGFITGKIKAKNLKIFGKVEANIEAENLELKSGAILIGNIKVESLSMESGVCFKGQCTMEINKDSKQLE